jgi:RNA polymerase sigma-70 factor (ECF subfamily)
VPEAAHDQRPDPIARRGETPGGGDGEAEGRRPELPIEFRAKLPMRDPEALARFYEIYFDRVYGYLRRMLGEDHLAEDVTQDVFMHIQRSIHTYDPARAPGPWLFTIATNKLRDHWRSRRHRDLQLVTTIDDEERRIEPKAREDGPLPALQTAELSRELSRAIDSLSPAMRETLVLRYFEGLSFEEIGERIGRNEAAVRKRYSRALADLRESLARYVVEGKGARS